MIERGDELVITGVGVATSGAFGLSAHWDLLRDGVVKADADAYSMRTFKPAAHLKDPRVMKAVSATDGIGLAALGDLHRANAPSATDYPAARCGIYTGSPGPVSSDISPYLEAMLRASDAQGHIDGGEFGRTAMATRPTTLLASLANNVLCYGSMIFEAQGPNSNYISGALSGHIAVQNAAKRLRRQQLDYVVAGGFGLHTEAVDLGMHTCLGHVLASGEQKLHTVMPYEEELAAAGGDGCVMADGGAFVGIERRGAAVARGAAILATYVAGATLSDGLGPMRLDPDGVNYSRAILQALAAAQVRPAEVGLVLGNASGIRDLDRCELAALRRVFTGLDSPHGRPALGMTTRVLGNLMEASGVVELGLVSRLFAHGELPAVMSAPASTGFSNHMDARQTDAPYALVLKASPWGEYSCIVLRRELS